MTGSYEKIAHYTILCEWSFYLLVVVGLVLLRRKRPDHPRPYKMWGYPLTPMSFAAVTLWALISSIFRSPEVAMLGLLVHDCGHSGLFLCEKIRAYCAIRRYA